MLKNECLDKEAYVQTTANTVLLGLELPFLWFWGVQTPGGIKVSHFLYAPNLVIL